MVAPNASPTVSARKIRANRRNARHSTGPRTEQGKARSSRNAVTHGVFAEQILLPNEDSHAFIELKRGILARLNPRDVLELQLVNQIVMINWRLERLRSAERRAYALETRDRRDARDSWLEMFRTMADDHDKGLDPSYINERKPTMKEMDDFDRMIDKVRRMTETMEPRKKRPSPGRLTMGLIQSGELDRISRYESRLQNNLHRALAELRKLREDPRPGTLNDFTGELLAQNEPTDDEEECNSNSEQGLADEEALLGAERQDESEMKMGDEGVDSPAEPSECSPRTMADDPGGG